MRKLGPKTWAKRFVKKITCEVCHKEPAYAFGWLEIDSPPPPTTEPKFWPKPMTAAEFLASPPGSGYQKDPPPLPSCLLTGDCTSGREFYDVTFQAFACQDTPQSWIDHVARKPWCDPEDWHNAIKRAGLWTDNPL